MKLKLKKTNYFSKCREKKGAPDAWPALTCHYINEKNGHNCEKRKKKNEKGNMKMKCLNKKVIQHVISVLKLFIHCCGIEL